MAEKVRVSPPPGTLVIAERVGPLRRFTDETEICLICTYPTLPDDLVYPVDEDDIRWYAHQTCLEQCYQTYRG